MTPSLAIAANNHALARHAVVYLSLVPKPCGDNLYASDGVRNLLYEHDMLTLTCMCKHAC